MQCRLLNLKTGLQGFVSAFNPYTLEISGTDGYLAVRGDAVFEATSATSGRLVQVNTLPEPEKLPINKWIDWCNGKTGVPQGITIDDAYSLTALTYASYKAAKTGEKTYVAF